MSVSVKGTPCVPYCERMGTLLMVWVVDSQLVPQSMAAEESELRGYIEHATPMGYETAKGVCLGNEVNSKSTVSHK